MGLIVKGLFMRLKNGDKKYTCQVKKFLVICFLWGVTWYVLGAQELSQEELQDTMISAMYQLIAIEFDGLTWTSKNYLQNWMGLTIGQQVNRQMLPQLKQRLENLGALRAISLDLENVGEN